MPTFDDALAELKAQIVSEVEQRIWERLKPQIQEEMQGRHLSVKECAQYLHVSTATVRRLIREHALPSFRVRGQIFIRQSDGDAFVSKQLGERG